MDSEKRICELAKELTGFLEAKLKKVSFETNFTVDDNLMSSKQHMQQSLIELKNTIEKYIKKF